MMSKLLKTLGTTSHLNLHVSEYQRVHMQSFTLYSQNEQFAEN